MKKVRKRSLDSMDSGSTEVEFEYNSISYKEFVANVELENLSMDEVRSALNRCSHKYAYWSALGVSVRKAISLFQISYDFWFARCCRECRRNNKRMSETAIKQEVILEYYAEYKEKMKKSIELTSILEKIDILKKTFDMQARNLQSVLNSLNTEMRNIQ